MLFCIGVRTALHKPSGARRRSIRTGEVIVTKPLVLIPVARAETITVNTIDDEVNADGDRHAGRQLGVFAGHFHVREQESTEWNAIRKSNKPSQTG